MEFVQATFGADARLGARPKLSWLSRSDTQLTGCGLQHLSDRTGLQEAWLEGTQVTDVSLAYLYFLHRPQRIKLAGTRVSWQGIRALESARADCEVQ